MAEGVEVGALTPRDLPAVGALFAARTGRPADLDRFASWIEASPSAAARRDGHLVGYAATTRFGPDLVELTSILVATPERGRGTGTALLAHLHGACRTAGIEAIVAVSSTGYAAREPHVDPVPFYERAGYRPAVRTAQSVVLVRSLEGEA